MLYHENKAKKQGFNIIIGVDEAGRGPLAGPVVASAVFLKGEKFNGKIQDSKLLSPCEREKSFQEISKKSYVGVGIVNESVIDAINILEATYVAMSQAVLQLIERLPRTKTRQKDFLKKVCILVDGNSFKTNLPYAFRTIVRGDQKSRSIACASIVAKVTRDRILDAYDDIYPQYGFKSHKGYPTLAHRRALKQHGPSAIHRKTFRYSEV